MGESEIADALIETIKNRVNANLDWFVRLTPMQLSNTMTDVIYNNINPMMLVTSIYQQHDRDKYVTMVDDMLERARWFYTAGVPY